jgi:hypothetical protein
VAPMLTDGLFNDPNNIFIRRKNFMFVVRKSTNFYILTIIVFIGLFFGLIHAESKKYQPEISTPYLGTENLPNFTISTNVTDRFGEIKNSTLTYSMTNQTNTKTVPMELTWGDRRNGSYIGIIDLQNRRPLYVNYTLSFIDDLGYVNSNESSFLTHFTDKKVPVVLSSRPEYADRAPLSPNSTMKIYVVPTINIDTIIRAQLTDRGGSGVKNATIFYTTKDFNESVSMQPADPTKPESRWNGKWRGEISNDRIPPNSIVSYYIIACDYAGNCSKKSARPMINYTMGMADKNHTDIKINILEVDPFNLTIKTEPTITEHIDQNSKSSIFEAIGIGNNNNSNVRWNSTERRILEADLLGEKSNYPFDSYIASIILAIPKEAGSELNEGFSYKPTPIAGANWNISASLKRIDPESVEKYCPDLELVFMVCKESLEHEHNSTFFRVDLSFNRNYTISGVIIPILAIFFLLGGIFIFQSNSDNISNRLALTLSVFALIFSLPEIIKSLKPETTFGPSIADSLLSIIVIGAISYTISSVIGSKLDSKESKLDSKESKLDSKESKLDSKESKLDSKESKLKSNLSNLKSKGWWQKWLDVIVFVFVAIVVIGFFVNYPYSVQNKFLIGSIILVGLGYGLLFKRI